MGHEVVEQPAGVGREVVGLDRHCVDDALDPGPGDAPLGEFLGRRGEQATLRRGGVPSRACFRRRVDCRRGCHRHRYAELTVIPVAPWLGTYRTAGPSRFHEPTPP